jgi:thioredoxin 1
MYFSYWYCFGLKYHAENKNMKKELSKADFDKFVINTSDLSIVKFKTDWSGACQIIFPIYEDLAKTYHDQADFFIVDVDKEQSIHLQYGLLELPAILFFKNGKLIDHAIGLTSKSILIDKIEKALFFT